MKHGVLWMGAALLAIGATAGVGAGTYLERGAAAEPPAQMVGWKFDRNREGMLTCRGLCERGGPHLGRFAVSAPPEKTPEGCVLALKPLCGGAP